MSIASNYAEIYHFQNTVTQKKCVLEVNRKSMQLVIKILRNQQKSHLAQVKTGERNNYFMQCNVLVRCK